MANIRRWEHSETTQATQLILASRKIHLSSVRNQLQHLAESHQKLLLIHSFVVHRLEETSPGMRS